MAFNLEHAFLRLVAGQSPGAAAAAARGLLGLAEAGYAAAVRRRNTRFDADQARSRQLPRPVVSVGNLTTGGTGKTPVVRWLAARLIERGHRPAVLTRGYKSADGVSDEAALLARPLPGFGAAPHVVVDPNRIAGAGRALAEQPETTCFLLDDGFQHRRVRRDLDIVLIDATQPFGFGRLLPRGLLREPTTSLARADVVMITRRQLVDATALERLTRQLAGMTAAPVMAIGDELSGFEPLTNAPGKPDGEVQAGPVLAGPVLAACGIGNPEAFAASLRRVLTGPVSLLPLPDHARFGEAELDRIAGAAARVGARAVVVTEKDAVKLGASAERRLGLPLLWARQSLVIGDGDVGRLLGLVEGAMVRYSGKCRVGSAGNPGRSGR
ncbi:MAG: tetraacyldisaccharide 4'-kinase [Phycisphaerae bacterium]